MKKHIEERDMLQEQAGFYKRYSKTIDVDVTECKNAEESAMKILEKDCSIKIFRPQRGVPNGQKTKKEFKYGFCK